MVSFSLSTCNDAWQLPHLNLILLQNSNDRKPVLQCKFYPFIETLTRSPLGQRKTVVNKITISLRKLIRQSICVMYSNVVVAFVTRYQLGDPFHFYPYDI